MEHDAWFLPLLALIFSLFHLKEIANWWLTYQGSPLFKISFATNEECERLFEKSEELRHWSHQLQAMGFQRLGWCHEKPRFSFKSYSSVSYIHAEKPCYANILLNDANQATSLFFYTPLNEQGIVFTRNHSSGTQMEQAHTSVKNLAMLSFSEIFSDHMQRLQALVQQGLQPQVKPGQQHRIAATRWFYRSHYDKTVALRFGLIHGFNLIILWTIIGYILYSR